MYVVKSIVTDTTVFEVDASGPEEAKGLVLWGEAKELSRHRMYDLQVEEQEGDSD